MEKGRLVRNKKEDKKKGSWRDKEKRYVILLFQTEIRVCTLLF